MVQFNKMIEGYKKTSKEYEELANFCEKEKAKLVEITKDCYNAAIDDFAKVLTEEYDRYNIDSIFATSRCCCYSNCVNMYIEFIKSIANQMKENHGIC